MAALKYMKPRDRGTIVQVGSALAYRGIPLQIGLLRRQTRHPGLSRSAALRTAARQEQRARHDGADAGRQHPAVLLGAVPAAAITPSRSRRSISPSSPPAACCSPPTTRSGASTGSGPPPWAPWPRTRSPRVCWIATSARPDSSPSRPSSPTTRTPRSTCGNRPTATDGHDFGAHGVFDDKSHEQDPQLWASHHHGSAGRRPRPALPRPRSLALVGAPTVTAAAPAAAALACSPRRTSAKPACCSPSHRRAARPRRRRRCPAGLDRTGIRCAPAGASRRRGCPPEPQCAVSRRRRRPGARRLDDRRSASLAAVPARCAGQRRERGRLRRRRRPARRPAGMTAGRRCRPGPGAGVAGLRAVG